MKKAIMLFLVVASVLVLAGCTQPQEESAGSPHPNESPTPASVSVSGGVNESIVPGSDRDAHGCIPSAGYTWCEEKQECLRPWEGNCTASEEETGPKAQFRKGPYLLFTGNSNNMTVLWQTNATPQNARIAWGTTTQYGGGTAAVQESGDHQFSYTINGLEAGTIYYYYVYVDGTLEKGSFRTAPPADATSITFYSYGDTRSDPHEGEQYQLERDKIAGQIVNCTADNSAEHQTILIHTGDYVARGLTESFWDDEYFNRSLQNSLDMMALLPIAGAIGNHETYAAGGSGESQEAGALFRKYWPNPLFADSDCFYYSFDYGPAHFVAIDQYKCDYDNTSAQYSWVEADLAATEKPWKIVFFHAPAWTAAEPASSEEINESSEEENAMAREYTPLFTREGVQLVLQGHRHFYARSHVNETVYLTLGGGGAPLGSPQDAPYLITSAGAYHFAKIEINGSTADVQIIGDEGNIIDSFSIDE
jgi:hypothetical protein